MSADNDRWLFPNGVDGATGTLLESRVGIEALALQIRKPGDTARAQALHERAAGTLGLPFDVDPLNVRKAGWGVVVPESQSAPLSDALGPLIRHRSGKVLTYRPGETRAKWLARHGVAAGSVDPAKVPFYLLLAGSSADMPFPFAHELAVEYPIGRLEFDRSGDYRQYAERIVAIETSRRNLPSRRAAFFGVRHDFDQATQLSADHLVLPLSDRANENTAVSRCAVAVSRDVGRTATKQRLRDLLREPDATRPALLFTASHGIGFGPHDVRQKERQGAIVCQDWAGPGSVSDSDYFAARDVPPANLDGLVAFIFACYGAGTPAHDRFSRNGGPPAMIARSPFIAALPRRLLLQGALAVVGHVERAWGYSIAPPDAGAQIGPFDNFIGSVLSGRPVGYAMKDFRDRYAALTVSLANLLERSEYENVPAADLVRFWIERNDAEGYTVIGDPAVTLRFGTGGSSV